MADAFSHFGTKVFSIFILCISLGAIGCTSTVTSPDTICITTPHPTFCKSILPDKPGRTIHDYGRFCLSRAVSDTDRFLQLINQHLESGSQYPESTIRALEDCQVLVSLNQDFFSTTSTSIGATNSTLPASTASLVQTLLSAVMTNVQTCSDGLDQAIGSSSSPVSDLRPYISNGTLVSSVSLALVTQGWGSHGANARQLKEEEPLISHWPRKTLSYAKNSHLNNDYRPLGLQGTRRGRKMLQVDGLNVNASNVIVVNPNGSGNFTTINDAIAAAPNNTKAGSGYFVIRVVAGVYKEYVSIPKNKQYLMMAGDGINKTIITGNHSVVDGWTTFNSATFAVVAEGFLAVNITFRNTAGAIKQQAVAVRNGADLSTFYRCSFEAYQDTLYAYSLRQFYRECNIYGTVDFIFGNAAVVFQDCNIFPRQPLQGQFNTITAQGRTDPNQNTGTSIQGATITAAPDLIASNFTVQSYLGRPWKNYSRTVFMESYMSSVINPAGWAEWSGTFALDTLYYAEYNNTGPGSNTSERVSWPGYHIINATVAVEFTVSDFISGDNWLPPTGVPYTGGLL
ncbi:hypothetical protein Droror1_Dr00023109 [Drosera rotundifolia]